MGLDIMTPLIFDMKYHASSFWGSLIGIVSVEQRDRLFRYDSRLSFYIFHEDNKKHSRDHFHAFIIKEKWRQSILTHLRLIF